MRNLLLILVLFVAGGSARAADDAPFLLRSPTLSRTQIVFNYGGYLWSVNREGGDARQLTVGGHEFGPIFSPDGEWIAFTGEYDGNVDVFVMPADGGVPRRLTWHPGRDVAAGWTPDGSKVVFRSGQAAYADFDRLYTISPEGGWPTALPMWRAEDASFSPDGTRVAYVPNMKWQASWKRYRGGQTTPIYIARLADLQLERVPRENSNDSNPIWAGDKIYFLSDRNGPVALFAYDTKTKQVSEAVKNSGLDFKSASAGPGGIVYEQFGEIHLFDPESGTTKRVNIHVNGDILAVRARFAKAASRISAYGISPSGVRALFETHGEIFTVPAEKGDIRNLTNSPGVADRDPAWSPDGKWIAYFSDESGEYAMHVREQTGMGEVKRINLGNPPSFFYSPTWSPDSKKIAYTDKRLNLWYVEVEKGKPIKVDTDRYEDPRERIQPAWAPDSRWIAYAKQLPSHLRAIYVYSLEGGNTAQITDGISDAGNPVFDKNGKALYFAASTDVGLSVGWLDLSSFQHPQTRNIYAAVLRKDLPSPLEPESDEEKVDGSKTAEPDNAGDKGKESEKGKEDEKAKESEKKKEPVKVTIDFENITQRIVALPIKAANYAGLAVGKTGTIYLIEQPLVRSLTDPFQLTISKFDLKTRKTEPFLSGVGAFDISANGEKVIYSQGPRPTQNWFIAGTAAAPKAGEGALKLDTLEVNVNPRAEWKQMYHEVWRIQRDFLYDPNHHGLDLVAAEKKYAPYLERLGGRADLNYLFEEMLGEVTIGHMFIGGGDMPEAPKVKGGLLGADYTIENSRYRFARIFNGESWNPNLRAPLTQPGVNVTVGEYLLAAGGRDVRPPASVHSFFENTAGRQVRIKVGPNPDGKGAQEVTVVPVESEFPLRNRAWEEDNRRKVDQLSGGKLAYVHVPDTAVGGYINFNRYYTAQIGREGAVIDERYNHGGQIADYIIDLLERPLRNCDVTREGEGFCSPLAQIYGPKTMVINEMSGSGGDALPWMFKQDHIGPLVGKRTWGGLVGIYGYPQLIDGGAVTAPRVAIYGLHGDWEVENQGIAPDIEVENDPASVAAGHDPQLERAVEVTLEALKKNPVKMPVRPAYPNYHKK